MVCGYSLRLKHRRKPLNAKRRREVSAGIILLLLFLGGAAVSRQVRAMDLSVELSGGYDDNPALTETPTGRFFAHYGVSLNQEILQRSEYVVEGLVTLDYRDYEADSDYMRLEGGMSLFYAPPGSRFQARFSAGAALYRDHLVEEDERDEAFASVRLDMVASPKLTLGMSHTWRWLDYRNPHVPFEARGYSGASSQPGRGGGILGGSSHVPIPTADLDKGRKNGGPAGRGKHGMTGKGTPDRDDVLVDTALHLDVFPAPSVNVGVYAGYAEANSSLDLETFSRLYAGFFLEWIPADLWRVELGGGWKESRYDEAPGDIDRRDVTRLAYVELGRRFGALGAFSRISWLENDSPLAVESYTQKVVQCGFSWAF